MFLSTKRAIWSAVISLIFVIYALNFVNRNVSIIAQRTLNRQILDYIVNFLIFFIAVYLILWLIEYLIKIFK